MGTPDTFRMMDMGRAGADYTAFTTMLQGQIVDAFAIPARMLPEPPIYPGLTFRRQQLALHLYAQHVSDQIIHRVLRLNPAPQEGCRLRGIRRTRDDDPRLCWGAIGKGEFIRRYGRARFEALPNAWKIKRGRRRYVVRDGIEISCAYLGEKVYEYMAVPVHPQKFHGWNQEWTAMRWAEFARQQGFGESA